MISALDRAAWASRWRHRNTGDKAGLALGLLVLAVAAPVWPGGVLAGAVAVVCALAWARVPVPTYLRAVAAPGSFIGVSALTVAVSVGRGDVPAWWRWGVLAITEPGTRQAATLLGRGFAAMAALMLLATTTGLLDIVTGLRRLRVPAELVEIAALVYRFVFLFGDTVARMHQAQVGRLGTATWRRAFHSAGLLASQVLVRSWGRAQRLEEGLAGRGFTGSLRVWTGPRPHSARFWAVSLALLAGVAVVAWWPRTWWPGGWPRW